MVKDWRIKYYGDLIITEYNRRIVESYSNKKFKDNMWLNTIFKREKPKHKDLDTVEILKLILKDVREGKYDKAWGKTR